MINFPNGPFLLAVGVQIFIKGCNCGTWDLSKDRVSILKLDSCCFRRYSSSTKQDNPAPAPWFSDSIVPVEQLRIIVVRPFS